MSKITVLTIAAARAESAQRIETEKPDRQKVIRVETAPNHLGVIELNPSTEVATGSSSFKVEWRGNKVFVQPLDPEATTNLFIWTASERLSYELVPKAVEVEKKKEIESKRKACVSKPNPASAAAKPGPEMKDGKPVFGSKTAPAQDVPTLFKG
jgi:type IV secretory pathway VirB9-like protein